MSDCEERAIRPPQFTVGRTILGTDGLCYNPTNDLIFPSIFRAGNHLTDALGRFYLYYAPHDAPGGICLAYADDLVGPWREHATNPVIRKSWPPHHDVDHVSSPHTLWRDDLGEMWLYYHGDNESTRWATSKDGVHFVYGGEAINASAVGMDGASYARVFTAPFPSAPARYLMVLLMYEYVEGKWDTFTRFGLYGAWSNDGATWDLVERPIIGHEDCDASLFPCSPFVSRLDDRVFMLYHGDQIADGRHLSNVYGVEIDVNLSPAGAPFLVCARDAFGTSNERISDPFLIFDRNQRWLFGAIGPRIHQRIGLAMANARSDIETMSASDTPPGVSL